MTRLTPRARLSALTPDGRFRWRGPGSPAMTPTTESLLKLPLRRLIRRAVLNPSNVSGSTLEPVPARLEKSRRPVRLFFVDRTQQPEAVLLRSLYASPERIGSGFAAPIKMGNQFCRFNRLIGQQVLVIVHQTNGICSSAHYEQRFGSYAAFRQECTDLSTCPPAYKLGELPEGEQRPRPCLRGDTSGVLCCRSGSNTADLPTDGSQYR